MGRKSGRDTRNRPVDVARTGGFNFRVGGEAAVYAAPGGDWRALHFFLDPTFVEACRRAPEKYLETAFREQTGLWQQRLEAQGYKMADTPLRWCRPARDPAKLGWVECIVGAHWKHDGAIMVISRDHLERKREEETRIGAGTGGDGGVAKLLRENPTIPILGGTP